MNDVERYGEAVAAGIVKRRMKRIQRQLRVLVDGGVVRIDGDRGRRHHRAGECRDVLGAAVGESHDAIDRLAQVGRGWRID